MVNLDIIKIDQILIVIKSSRKNQTFEMVCRLRRIGEREIIK